MESQTWGSNSIRSRTRSSMTTGRAVASDNGRADSRARVRGLLTIRSGGTSPRTSAARRICCQPSPVRDGSTATRAFVPCWRSTTIEAIVPT